MTVLAKLRGVVTARWFISLIGALVLGLLIWFFGPLLAFGTVRPFETEIARLVAILVITFAWGLSNLYAQHRARKANDELVKDLAPSPEQVAVGEELDELGRRFQDALGTLRRARFGSGGGDGNGERGRRYLYQLPWYILIGPPGSGKTTALVHSGLRFPLEGGPAEVRGVGGTRNCDWFFTDEAVLIDTAGRYVTQDSDRQVDQAAWRGFLDLLRKHRGRQPINGVLIGISLVELAQMGREAMGAHARAVRQRLTELNEQLGLRLPVYVLFTKSDLIAGFTEFFDDLDREARQQVWGITLPYRAREGQGPGPLDAFGAEFDRLVERLNERTVERLQTEPDLERRGLIFGFPQQVASLKATATEFLDEVFRGSRYDTSLLLRGVYFTSGTQDGTPIDRLMSGMAAAFGLARQPLAALRGPIAAGRSYFLTRPLRDVVFAEASLATTDPARERRRRWLQAAVYAAAALLVVVASVGWWVSYVGNRDRLVAFGQGLAAYAREAEPFAGRPVIDDDLIPILPALAELGDLPAGPATAGDEGDPLGLRLGLSQRPALESHAWTAYRHGLDGLLLPRLLARLEHQLRAHMDQPEYLYEGLRVYLMLGREAPLDPELVRAWLGADWASRYADPRLKPARAELVDHLDALLAEPLRKIALDGDLVRQVRATLTTRLPLAARGYRELLDRTAELGLPEWRLSEEYAAGPRAGEVFTRRSGRPLHAGVPGLYTYDGFHYVVLDQVGEVARTVADESWIVLGRGGEPSDDDLRQLEREILGLYYDDYIRHWDEVLRDVTLTPLGGLDEAVDALFILSGDGSPLRRLLEAINRETRLTVPPPEPEEAAAEDEGSAVPGAAVTAVAKVATKKLGKAGAKAKKFAKLFGSSGGQGGGGAGGGTAAETPGQPVEAHFADLQALVEGANGVPPALPAALDTLAGLYERLHEVSLSPNPGAALAALGGNPAAPLADAAGRMPEPLNEWLGGVAKESASFARSGVRRDLNAKWQTDVLPFCRQALTNRFPFVLDSEVDVVLGDFTRLFAPGGLIDNFFNTHLRPFADTTRRPWRWQRDLGLSSGALAQFERAAAIRDGLFGGGPAPSVSFELKPVTLDAAATQVLLDFDGQVVSYNHGPPQAVPMRWPGPNGSSTVRLSMAPMQPGEPSSISREGAWSWFRLLREARFEPTSLPERYLVTFAVGSRTATFELRAESVVNPFNLRALGQFQCPEAL